MNVNEPLLKTNLEQEYPDYLRDESRRRGRADGLCFARTEEEIRQVMAGCQQALTLTTQGARTGVTGGAVPEGGYVVNLSRMNRMTALRYEPGRDEFFLTVQPGVVLSQLRTALSAGEFDAAGWSPESLAALERYRRNPSYFFAPDPTELSASLGGMVACNASGACSFRYGATRNYVEMLEVMLPDGDLLILRRGVEKAQGRSFSIKTRAGRLIAGRLPDTVMPQVKNAAGYFVQDNMDLIDLFIGSEGTLGLFTAIELRLIPEPACRWGIVSFFPTPGFAVSFVQAIRGGSGETSPVAIEYFDRHSLDLLLYQKQEQGAFTEIPDIPQGGSHAVYVEYHGAEESLERAMETLLDRIVKAGGLEQHSWMADTPQELERLKAFRHAVPEAVNRVIDERRKSEPALTKLGTDMAVPDDQLGAVIDLYREGLQKSGLDHVIFGHIGNNHLHVNILPRSLEEYEQGKALYLDWARRIIAMGGTISAEHGVGKLKVALLREMVGEEAIRQMRELKRLFDPGGILNRGNLFRAYSHEL
jgi:D-lactate dehydrogenase (cytochrome)